jgi:WD40 repeat protein
LQNSGRFFFSGDRLTLLENKDRLQLREFGSKQESQPVRDKPAENIYWHGKFVFSAGGKLCAESLRNGTIQVWDLIARKPLRTINARGALRRERTADFSTDSRFLAAPDGDSVKVWDLVKGVEALNVRDPVAAFRFLRNTPPTVLRMVARDGTVKDWNASDSRTQLVTHLHVEAGDLTARNVATVFISYDGKRVIRSRGTQTFWDLNEPKIAKMSPVGSWKSVPSPDGRFLADIAGDEQIEVWDAETNAELLNLTGRGAYFAPKVRFSPDGGYVAFVDDPKQCVSVVDIRASGTHLLDAPARRWSAIAIAENAKGLAVGRGNVIELFDPATLVA